MRFLMLVLGCFIAAAVAVQAQARIAKIEEVDSLATATEITLKIEVASDMDFFPYPVVMAVAGKDTLGNKGGELSVYGIIKGNNQTLSLRTLRLPKTAKEYTIVLMSAESTTNFSTTALYKPNPYKAPKTKKEKKAKTPPAKKEKSEPSKNSTPPNTGSVPPVPPTIDK